MVRSPDRGELPVSPPGSSVTKTTSQAMLAQSGARCLEQGPPPGRVSIRISSSNPGVGCRRARWRHARQAESQACLCRMRRHRTTGLGGRELARLQCLIAGMPPRVSVVQERRNSWVVAPRLAGPDSRTAFCTLQQVRTTNHLQSLLRGAAVVPDGAAPLLTAGQEIGAVAGVRSRRGTDSEVSLIWELAASRPARRNQSLRSASNTLNRVTIPRQPDCHKVRAESSHQGSGWQGPSTAPMPNSAVCPEC